MRSLLLLIFIALFSAPSLAITVEVRGRDGNSLYSGFIKLPLPVTVGEVTTTLFDRDAIPYAGGEAGIASIFGIGNDIDLISDSEMKAYGWCFRVDGILAETMPDKTEILFSRDHIVWFYAYAHYKEGRWISQCQTDQ